MIMKKYKLGDILELQRGYDLPLSQQETGNVLVAGSNGIIGSHNEARSNHPCITVGRSGSVGKVHYYEQPTWAHNTTLFVKDFKRNSPQYLYYFLKNLHLDKMFAKGSSVVPSLDRKVVHSLVVPFPKDIVYQKQIASVLSNLDRKIALNRSINHNLEAMAKQLYDYWFVQFDFPDENGKPYKSSGGKMVWNEKLKREIPEGWHCFRLNEIEPNIVTGKTPSTTDETNFGGDIPFITIDDIRKSRFVFQTTRTLSEKGAYSQLSKYIPIGSLCCSCIGTVGILGFVGKRGQTNQQVNTVVFENEHNKEYIYFSLGVYFSYANAKVGNILPNMSKEDFCQIPLLYPTKALVMEYHKKVEHLFNQIECLIANIEGHTKLRDSLLPLLMNGQVSVNYDLSND